MGLRRLRRADHQADPAAGARLAGLDARLSRRGKPAAGQRPGRPGDRVRVGTDGVPRRAVHRAWPLLPRGADAMGRAGDIRGDQVRDGGRVDRGVRLRTRCAPDQRAGTNGSPPPVLAGVTREPAFVLAGRTGVVVADGVHTAFPRLADARAALASHSAPIILGALPFDITKPAALISPQAVQFSETLPD